MTHGSTPADKIVHHARFLEMGKSDFAGRVCLVLFKSLGVTLPETPDPTESVQKGSFTGGRGFPGASSFCVEVALCFSFAHKAPNHPPLMASVSSLRPFTTFIALVMAM